MKIDYERFIEENFLVIDRDTQVPVPYRLNEVQKKYIKILMEDHPEFEGGREIILKARQQGFSSFILALFTVDFICRPYSKSICIAHKKDATEKLFKKVKFYLESYCKKHGFNVKEYLGSETKEMITSKVNNAEFYILTAGSRVGGRGDSVRNLHFSEAAFYQDTEIITASEMITATLQQVQLGRGMVFIESTANGMGNYYQLEWDRAVNGESVFKPRFFGWQEFYTPEWIEEKKKEFHNEKIARQEYPADPEEAFISSGEPFFDLDMLKVFLNKKARPVRSGHFAMDGEFA